MLVCNIVCGIAQHAAQNCESTVLHEERMYEYYNLLLCMLYSPSEVYYVLIASLHACRSYIKKYHQLLAYDIYVGPTFLNVWPMKTKIDLKAWWFSSPWHSMAKYIEVFSPRVWTFLCCPGTQFVKGGQKTISAVVSSSSD